MFDASLLGESRPEFIARLDTSSTFDRWAAATPALSCGGDVDSIAGLFAELGPRSRPTHHDTLLGALLQLAAHDGGDDADAVLAVLHAMTEGAARLARRGYGDGLVLGELTIQIRAYRWRQPRRAVAATLLRNTAHALCCEENHAWMRTRQYAQRVSEHAVGIQPWSEVDADEPTSLGADEQNDDGLDLVDLLLWAERTGVVDARDLSMLVEYHYGRESTGAGHGHVARLFGVTERTSKRRCAAAMEALRAAVPQYLAS
jgi:hypothetical protein